MASARISVNHEESYVSSRGLHPVLNSRSHQPFFSPAIRSLVTAPTEKGRLGSSHVDSLGRDDPAREWGCSAP